MPSDLPASVMRSNILYTLTASWRIPYSWHAACSMIHGHNVITASCKLSDLQPRWKSMTPAGSCLRMHQLLMASTHVMADVRLLLIVL
jgi:hypothetical protein